MKQSLQIISGTLVAALGLFGGLLWCADLMSLLSTSAPPASAVEWVSCLFALLSFVGAIGSLVVAFVCFAGFLTLALDKSSRL